MPTIILILFTFLLLVIFIYSLAQLNLLLNFLKDRKKKDTPEKFNFSELPCVTIQLPIYNDAAVVERLLTNIIKLDYPKQKLEIQVLDDSSDGSVTFTAQLIAEIASRGTNICHLVRRDRKGFKAGALREGLITAKGEFIAIFDSDFLPEKDWLLKTVPYFKNKELGVVQTRWGHLNRNYSLLTRLQAFLLDFHFVLEQKGRNLGKHFINFNGTAGIWRKTCIMEAGNWEGDTLTEDLDLSYRAQLKGWKFKYLEDVVTPAELPITLEATRSQQFRWNKGAAENFQKHFMRLYRSPNVSAGTKFHSFFHLLNSSLFLIVLLLALLSIPVLFISSEAQFPLFTGILIFFSLSTLVFYISYWITYASIHGTGFKSFFSFSTMFFVFFSIAMGLSLHISRAVLEGHLGKKSEFVRTPKFNLSGKNRFSEKVPVRLNLQLLLEGLLMLLFAFAIVAAFQLDNFSLLLFHLMLFFGFSYVFFTSIKSWDWNQKNKKFLESETR